MNKFQKLVEYFDKNKVGNLTAGLAIGILIIAMTAKLGFNLNDDSLEKSILDRKFIIAFVILVTLILMFLVSFIVKFLSDEKSSYSREQQLNDFRRRRRDQTRLNQLLNDQHQSQLNLQDLREIEKRISNNLDQKYEMHHSDRALQKQISYTLAPLLLNNQKYIDTIQKNSIINLVIGIIGTVITIIILSFAVLSGRVYSNINDFIIHLVPRITFVAFIQIFAFFFLRLYKNNLEDGKYFQNELTNLNAKCAALTIAILTKNTDKQSEILANLVTTERNFKIQKEETDFKSWKKQK